MITIIYLTVNLFGVDSRKISHTVIIATKVVMNYGSWEGMVVMEGYRVSLSQRLY